MAWCSAGLVGSSESVPRLRPTQDPGRDCGTSLVGSPLTPTHSAIWREETKAISVMQVALCCCMCVCVRA